MTQREDRSGGFTLLETLIALVIASITALVLLQSIASVAQGSARVNRALAEALEREFSVSAVRDALASAAPDYLDKPGVYTGGTASLSGLTRRPVLDAHGVPAPFSMTLTPAGDGTVLTYREGETAFEVMRFEAAGAEFRYAYRTLTGLYAGDPPETMDVWPPEADFDPFYDHFRPPPDLVMVVDSEGTLLWAVASAGWHAPPMRGSDVEDIL
ncbi:MAG: hypothetical protein CMH93_02085 [Oceanicaulis sp.]|jgi:prepilin-type N-terminal cleavage/methylation domain-containing protein|nr:hypothetical protein [Oceanicaulis sp.]